MNCTQFSTVLFLFHNKIHERTLYVYVTYFLTCNAFYFSSIPHSSPICCVGQVQVKIDRGNTYCFLYFLSDILHSTIQNRCIRCLMRNYMNDYKEQRTSYRSYYLSIVQTYVLQCGP